MAAAALNGDAPRLRGDLAIWLVIAAELLTFGLLFVAYAFARSRDPALFDAGQAQLDLQGGAINTVLLIAGSWCVAHAVDALRHARRRAAGRWLAGALAAAAGFLALKASEFVARSAAGLDLETNTFWTFYWLLTGFHFLHVVAAAVLLLLVGWRLHQGAYGPGDVHAPETAAAFWHMVDLLWIVLFPLVYVMR